ncbi:hypothetical protein BDN70DRAFT_810647 [Pholiota conissans]|uniref:Microbial-type PARG catalytic domain-containing protein n=1 Tax=Pholiota conissans TaxID=109636 RepID=A0A9P5YYE2_9AGAR|nr:hypothetical protein BDN70DRAFT_810647 [Pholiota conissans]
MYTDDRRAILRSIADETLNTLEKGLYVFRGVDYKLNGRVQDAKKNTRYYAPECSIISWGSTRPRNTFQSPAHISVLQISTLDAARLLESMYRMEGHQAGKTGVLNFASATQPGGGFKNGAEAQEESIARSSTLYPVLTQTAEAAKYYDLHVGMNRPAHAYYTHAIIYSPGICVFRDDDGVFTYPFTVDVLSCAAVNAGEVRKTTHTPTHAGLEVEIEKEMAERMGRILYVFEKQGASNLVLGTFGTGVFRNDVATVARLWAHLLVVPEARFKHSFERIIFAITGEETFAEFQSAFDAWMHPSVTRASNRNARASGQGDLIQL